MGLSHHYPNFPPSILFFQKKIIINKKRPIIPNEVSLSKWVTERSLAVSVLFLLFDVLFFLFYSILILLVDFLFSLDVSFFASLSSVILSLLFIHKYIVLLFLLTQFLSFCETGCMLWLLTESKTVHKKTRTKVLGIKA